jgi:hypothetical protein
MLSARESERNDNSYQLNDSKHSRNSFLSIFAAVVAKLHKMSERFLELRIVRSVDILQCFSANVSSENIRYTI